MQDFLNGITPVPSVEISGIGGEITIKGKGTVRIRVRADNGKWIDKLISNVYYTPASPVRLLSITQLARESCGTTYVTMDGIKTTLVWEGGTFIVHHPPPATVPFLEAYTSTFQLRQILYQTLCFYV